MATTKASLSSMESSGGGGAAATAVEDVSVTFHDADAGLSTSKVSKVSVVAEAARISAEGLEQLPRIATGTTPSPRSPRGDEFASGVSGNTGGSPHFADAPGHAIARADEAEKTNSPNAAKGQRPQDKDSLRRVRIGHPREDSRQVKRIFWLFFALQIMTNYDSGAIPCAIDKIQDYFGLTKAQLGLLGRFGFLCDTLLHRCSGKTHVL